MKPTYIAWLGLLAIVPIFIYSLGTDRGVLLSALNVVIISLSLYLMFSENTEPSH